MTERKIIQLTEKSCYLYALCNDGTVLVADSGKWHVVDLGPVPQPDEQETKEQPPHVHHD